MRYMLNVNLWSSFIKEIFSEFKYLMDNFVKIAYIGNKHLGKGSAKSNGSPVVSFLPAILELS